MLRTRNNYNPSVSLLFKKPTVIMTIQQDLKCAYNVTFWIIRIPASWNLLRKSRYFTGIKLSVDVHILYTYKMLLLYLTYSVIFLLNVRYKFCKVVVV